MSLRLSTQIDVTISDLSITGGAVGIVADAGSASRGLTLQNPELYGNTVGIVLDASNDDASIIDSTIHGSPGNSSGDAGIYVAANNPLISGDTIFGNGQDGVDTEGQYATVDDNVVNDNGGMGILGGVYRNDCLISDNDVHANGRNANDAGIHVAVWNATVSGNQVHDNEGDGIDADGGAPAGAGAEILAVGNTTYGNTGTGIDVEGDADARDNVVYDNQDGIIQGSIQGSESETEGTIEENRVYGNSDIGISAAVDGRVSHNEVYSNAIGIQGTDFSFPDPNSALAPGSPFQGSILNNVVYANSDVGILIADGDGAQVTNNTVYQPQGDGVRVNSTMS
jgi:parallel beta-helix repeat protein